MIELAVTVQAFPDRTGFAPKDEAWRAYDVATYDGAPNSGHQIVGYGASAEQALADYRRILDERDEQVRIMANRFANRGQPKAKKVCALRDLNSGPTA